MKIDIEDVHLGYQTVDLSVPSTVIVDIDGTLADISHRRHFVETKPKNWAAFEKLAHLDPVHEHIAEVVRMMYDYGWTVLIVSGRGEQQRTTTIDWLWSNQISHHGVYMRAKLDYRADDIVKSEILDMILASGRTPTLVLDDRDRVVKMWRDRGLKVIQVAEGDF